jgi:hypothetical protein
MPHDIERRLKDSLDELTESHQVQHPFRPGPPTTRRPQPMWRDSKVLVVAGGIAALVVVLIGLGIRHQATHQVTASSTSSTVPGSPQKAVGNVIGLTEAAAADVLGTEGFNVGKVLEQLSNRYATGRVVSQDPPAGARLAPGASVSLVVSSGTPSQTPVSLPPAGTLEVPNVLGLTTEEAVAALRAAGFANSIDDFGCHGSVRPGHVVDQNPPQGYRASQGSRISLQISCQQPTTTTTTP